MCLGIKDRFLKNPFASEESETPITKDMRLIQNTSNGRSNTHLFLPGDFLFVLNFKRQFDVWIAVAEAGDVCHLDLIQLQQPITIVILHLHYVKDAVDFLQKYTDADQQRI